MKLKRGKQSIKKYKLLSLWLSGIIWHEQNGNSASSINVMKIRVKIKNVFGNERIYVVCKNALYISRLTGKKTIDRTDINSLENLGFTFEVQA